VISLTTYNKHLWLVPIVVVFILLSAAVVLEQSADPTIVEKLVWTDAMVIERILVKGHHGSPSGMDRLVGLG
jgi:hypothetical protein